MGILQKQFQEKLQSPSSCSLLPLCPRTSVLMCQRRIGLSAKSLPGLPAPMLVVVKSAQKIASPGVESSPAHSPTPAVLLLQQLVLQLQQPLQVDLPPPLLHPSLFK